MILKEESVVSFFKLHGLSQPDEKRLVGGISDHPLSPYVSGKDVFIKNTAPVQVGDTLEIQYQSREPISGLKMDFMAEFECMKYDDHSSILRNRGSNCVMVYNQ